MDNKLLHGNHVPGGNSDPIESTQCNDRPGSNDWHCNDRLQKIIISHENTPNGYIHLSRTKHPDVMFYTGTCPFAVICVFETVGITFTPFEHERLANTLHVWKIFSNIRQKEQTHPSVYCSKIWIGISLLSFLKFWMNNCFDGAVPSRGHGEPLSRGSEHPIEENKRHIRTNLVFEFR